MIARRLTASFFLLLWLPLAALADEAGDWLARVGPALRGLDYQGTLVVVAEGRVETLRVFHAAGGDRERLVALSGPPREVIRDGRRVMSIGAGEPAVAYDLDQAGRWSVALALSEAAGLTGYRARLAGEGRVAGHAAVRVEVLADDAWRYGYRLWLERESALPLRVDLLDRGGRVVEQVAFTELQLGVAPDEADLRPSSGAPLRRVAGPPPASHGGVAWQVPAPPPGFRLRAARPLPGGGAHLLYGDGLASVSVYVEPAGEALRGSLSQQRGAVHARSFWLDGWQVLALGKVPPATVEHFARTVRPVPPGG